MCMYMSFAYNKRFLVDVLHVQRHEVLAATQVKTSLILVHVENSIVTGVEGEAERSYCPSVHQLW